VIRPAFTILVSRAALAYNSNAYVCMLGECDTLLLHYVSGLKC